MEWQKIAPAFSALPASMQVVAKNRQERFQCIFNFHQILRYIGISTHHKNTSEKTLFNSQRQGYIAPFV
jgi:hypothetical protein